MQKIWRSEWFQLIASLLLVPALLWALFFLAPVLVKVAGAPFLVIPSALGLVQRASADEVVVLSTSAYNTTFFLPRAGRYVIYADDVFWNRRDDTEEVRQSALVPGRKWLDIQYLETEEPIPLRVVHRGLRPYDELAARGRPMFTFQAPGPGWYSARYLYSPPAYVAVLPDYVTDKEDQLIMWIILQLGLLLTYPTIRTMKRWRERRETQRRKREEAERVWQILREEREKRT